VKRLAINALRAGRPDAAAVDAFLAGREVPIVEGARCTFLFRGEAEAVHLAQRVHGLPELIPLRRVHGTDLWYLVLELPAGSRVNYQLEIRRGGHVERMNDPLNEKLSYSPVGTSSVCFAHGYETPDWTVPDPDARPGDLVEITLPSRALRSERRVTVYLPARFRRTATYPLLLVHDGGDFLQYAAAKTVLDNLIHRLDVAETVVAFTHPGERLGEYANSAAHSRFLTAELVPHLESTLPLTGQRSGRCLLGASFGAVASLAAAHRAPTAYGSLVLMSGSFVHTDIGTDHGEDPVFDPVVRFVNRYRERPRRLADRLWVGCGVYEPLIAANRSIVPKFESTGMTVRFVETRDGHNWENWRDTLRDALSWVLPGPQKWVYE
jgi:enterochelin esterase family protein